MLLKKTRESELYGAAINGAAATRFSSWWMYGASISFGYAWMVRTYGLGALKIQCTKLGIQSIEAFPLCSTKHPTFKVLFAASKHVHWFELMEGEMLTGILFRESDTHDRITSLRLQTNKRRSQWFGSGEGTLRKIEAPAGFYIHSIHGSCQGSECRTLGAYFVPLALQQRMTSASTWVADSKMIGNVSYDSTSHDNSFWSTGTIRAIVFMFSQQLQPVDILNPVQYQRYIAVTTKPMEENFHVLVFAEDELILRFVLASRQTASRRSSS